MNQYEINKRKAELAEELKKLESQEAYLNSLTDEMRLAEALHDMQCHQNHTDRCSWEYEKWGDGRSYSAHDTYLAKAKKVMEKLPLFSHEEIIEIAQALR